MLFRVLVICISPLHLPLCPCVFPHELCRGVCLCVSVLWGGGGVGSGLQLPLLPCNLQLARKYMEMFHKSANLPLLKTVNIPQKVNKYYSDIITLFIMFKEDSRDV